jgi:hypothetical protein
MMKVVKVEILPAKDGEVVTAIIKEEEEKGGNWKETSKTTVKSGTPEAVRSILLDDNERITIEGKVDNEVVIDKDQMAAREEPRSDEAKEKKQKADQHQAKRFEEFPEQKEAKEKREKAEREQKKRDETAKGSEEKGSEEKWGSDQEPRREEIPRDSKSVRDEVKPSTPKPTVRR